MSEYVVDVLASVMVTVNDQEAIGRVTGPGGDEWRSMFYRLYTPDDVLAHWAFNALVNGVEQVNVLEGWGDLPRDAVTFLAERAVETIRVETK